MTGERSPTSAVFKCEMNFHHNGTRRQCDRVYVSDRGANSKVSDHMFIEFVVVDKNVFDAISPDLQIHRDQIPALIAALEWIMGGDLARRAIELTHFIDKDPVL